MANVKISALTALGATPADADLIEVETVAGASRKVTRAELAPTNAEIAALAVVTANTAKVTYPSADSSKLAGIETAATADQTGAEIKVAYEAEANTNAFTDADVINIGNQSGVNTGDEVAASETVAGVVKLATQAETDTGTDATRAVTPAGLATIQTDVDANTAKVTYPSADSAKLAAIEAAADVTDATNVAAAGAVMDSDVSPAEGILRKTGSGAYTAIKTNLAATTDPGVSNDSSAGYGIGSLWINVTLDKVFQAVDVTVGAAVWKELSGAAGGGSYPSGQAFTMEVSNIFSYANSVFGEVQGKGLAIRLPAGATITGAKISYGNWLAPDDTAYQEFLLKFIPEAGAASGVGTSLQSAPDTTKLTGGMYATAPDKSASFPLSLDQNLTRDAGDLLYLLGTKVVTSAGWIYYPCSLTVSGTWT